MGQTSLQDLLAQYQTGTSGKYISQEFQDYAYRLAMDIGKGPEDRETIALCMRLVKKKPRALIEVAHSFVSDAPARNKVALFLWKLKELEKEKKAAKKTE
jgi:hypothetical protein